MGLFPILQLLYTIVRKSIQDGCIHHPHLYSSSYHSECCPTQGYRAIGSCNNIHPS